MTRISIRPVFAAEPFASSAFSRAKNAILSGDGSEVTSWISGVMTSGFGWTGETARR